MIDPDVIYGVVLTSGGLNYLLNKWLEYRRIRVEERRVRVEERRLDLTQHDLIPVTG